MKIHICSEKCISLQKKKVTKEREVITYDVPTPPGDKKGIASS